MEALLHPALFRLVIQSFVGRIRRSLRLAKQPKYLFGALVGFAYFGSLFFRHIPFNQGPNSFERAGDDLFFGVQVMAAIAMAVYLSFAWAFLPKRPSFSLREPELNLLMTGPLSRRQVLQYVVFKSIPGILLSVIVLSVFISRGSPLDKAVQGVGMFALFWLWDLHSKAKSLWRLRLDELPPWKARFRRSVMFGFLAVFWVVTVLALVELGKVAYEIISQLEAFNEEALGGIVRGIRERYEESYLRYLLAPLVWLTGPYFLREGSVLSWSWLYIFGVVAAHYLWVVTSKTRFEELLLERERVRAMSGPGKRSARFLRLKENHRVKQPFRLLSQGRREVAVFFKHLVLITRRSWLFFFLIWLAVVLFCVALQVILGSPKGLRVTMFVIGIVAITVFPSFGAMMWGNGFRKDLRYIETLRTWPLTGRQMVRGQIMAPYLQTCAAILLGIGICLGAELGVILANLLGRSMATSIIPDDLLAHAALPSLVVMLGLIATVIPITLSVAAVSSVLEATSVLLFPGWVLASEKGRGDIASMGQKILLSVGFALFLGLGLLPGGLILAGVFTWHHFADVGFRWWELPILSLLCSIPLLVEAWLMTRLGGKLWDKMDPSQEILEGFS